MSRGVGLAPDVLAGQSGEFHALPLAFPATFIVVTRDLQGKLSQHVLHGLEYYLGDATGIGGHFGQVDDARHAVAKLKSGYDFSCVSGS